ncbi:MAG: type I-E CRISPR-associated protein Cse1/CasA [Spirochaetes bacterium]|jgi:CRISPR system Cascade subunit CasA|nr:type I-E CRISPR-associated protein Cse1/CasA [Spirochaetota bacterium]
MNRQNKGFNLVDEKWIPVTNLKGEYRLIGLMDVFADGENYADLAVRPHERVSLMRLLLCIAHASLDGPEDYDDWLNAKEILPGAARNYLDKWRDSFDLFHPKKPFLQIANLTKSQMDKNQDNDDEGGQISLSKLDHTLASGVNPTLFDHEASSQILREFSPSEIAVQLLSFQNFFLAGGKTAAVIWGGIPPEKKPPNPSDGPCSPGSMYHCFIRSSNIAKTINKNLITKKELRMHYSPLGENYWGNPIWEKFPSKRSDVDFINNATETYLGRLVPLSRLIRILPSCDCMIIGEGLMYRSFNSKIPFPPEVTATVILSRNTKKQIFSLLRFNPETATWRELPSMVVKRKAQQAGGPLCLMNIDQNESVDFHILALARDQASIIDMVDSVYHVNEKMFSNAGRAAYENEVQFAEIISKKLGWAIEEYRKAFDGGWEGRLKSSSSSYLLRVQIHSKATTHYWTTIEKSLPLLMLYIEAIGTSAEKVEATRKVWQKTLFAAARESYKLVCGRETPRQIRAFVLGWRVLNKKEQDTNSIQVKTNQEEENL